MLLGILNFVTDNSQAKAILERLVGAAPPGSYLAVGHPTGELTGGDQNQQAVAFWNQNAVPPIRTRTRAELVELLNGLELLEPGLVSLTRWRPDDSDRNDPPPEVPEYGALARKT